MDELRAEIAKLKAKTAQAGADARLKMNKQIQALERKIDEGKAKLAELAEAGEDAWESLKNGVESAWSSLKSEVSEAATKFSG